MEHPGDGRSFGNNNLSTFQMSSTSPVLPAYSGQNQNALLPGYCFNEPPPPYSQIDKVQAGLPVSRPPRYEGPDSPCRETSPSPVDDRPFTFSKEFATSKFAVLKLLEFAVCIIGLSSTALFQRSDAGKQGDDLTSIFMFLMVAGFVCTIIMFWFHYISIFDYAGPSNRNKSLSIFYFILGSSFLVTSALIAEINRLKICKVDEYSRKACHLHRLSMMSGFFAMILFLADSVIYIISRKTV